MDNDVVLVDRALINKDEKAFLQLMLRHQFLVRRLAYRLSKNNTHMVDDFVQETFMRAFNSLHLFRGDCAFSTWLYRIAKNVVLDYHRRKAITYCEFDVAVEFADYRAELHHCELRADLIKAISSISTAQQTAFRLCVAEGYSHSAAAKMMNIPVGTVKTHVARGKIQLQALLAHWAVA